MRRGRRFRWLVVGVVLLIGIYFVADVVGLQYLESQGASQVAQVMAAEEASVDLGGIPFIFSFLRGRLTDVSVDVRGASAAGGLRVEKVEAKFGEVRFSPSRIFSLARSSFSTRTRIDGKDVLGRLELREQDIEDYIRRVVPVVGDVAVRSTGIQIRFIKPGVNLLENANPGDEDLTTPARFIPKVEAGKLGLVLIGVSDLDSRFRVEAGRLEKVIDLPTFPSGVSTDVRLGDGAIVLESTGAEVSFEVGEGDPGE